MVSFVIIASWDFNFRIGKLLLNNLKRIILRHAIKDFETTVHAMNTLMLADFVVNFLATFSTNQGFYGIRVWFRRCQIWKWWLERFHRFHRSACINTSVWKSNVRSNTWGHLFIIFWTIQSRRHLLLMWILSHHGVGDLVIWQENRVVIPKVRLNFHTVDHLFHCLV